MPRRAGPPVGVAGLKGARVVEGRADGVTMRVETNQQQSQTIWSFRLERYDEAGNRVLLVPVEMRGLGFEGSLSDGDSVRAHGRARGGTFHATTVDNLTTGAVVRAKTVPLAVKVVFFVIFALILTFIGWIAVSIFMDAKDFPEAPSFEEGGMQASAEQESGHDGASWVISAAMYDS